MRKSIQKITILLLIACACKLTVFAQIKPVGLQQHIAAYKEINKTELNDFYAPVNYQPQWFKPGGTGNRDQFLNILEQAAGLGLSKMDYQYDYFEGLQRKNFILQNNEDSLQAEIRFSDAALHFYHDIAYGHITPAFGYDGLKYKPGCLDIPALLAAYLNKHNLQSLSGYLSPALPEIKAIELRIGWFNKVIADSSYSNILITSNKVIAANKALIKKLYQLGITQAVTGNIPDSSLIQYVKEAQRQFGLLVDGVLRSTILQELNVPLIARLQQLNVSINYYRWLKCLAQDQPVIVVNIPAAYMKVYSNNNTILEMRMVVGKKSTPTPTLTSTIDNVVLYPYWHIPYSIATKELLPVIKRNPGFIDAGNYQVLNKAGKIVDPYSINWNALSRTNFPYLIRQSTGCDNALGLLKLNFYSPFGVYLHDTNNRNAFMLNKRYFSHGCMRMEKPVELGHLVLKHNPIAIDTLEQKGCLRNQSPITVPADVHMRVIVWYNLAGIDSTGRVLFYEDVYKKFTAIKK